MQAGPRRIWTLCISCRSPSRRSRWLCSPALASWQSYDVSNGVVQSVRALANGNGIDGVRAEVRRCFARNNLVREIIALHATVVRNGTSRNDGSVGIACTDGSIPVPRAFVLFGTEITENGVPPTNGSTTSLGHSQRCDSAGAGCLIF